MIALDANEGILEPADANALLSAVGAQELSRYPAVATLEARYAAWIGVESDRVLATAGADDAIDRLLRAAPGRRVVTTTPTFGVIAERARRVDADLVEVPWLGGPLPVVELARAAKDAALLLLVSPNNPTGAAVRSAELVALRQAAPAPLLVLDAAYDEFAREPLGRFAVDLERTVVLRTLSKAWALAGLRVGFAVGAPGEIGRLRGIAPPFPIARSSIAMAERAIGTLESAMWRRVRRVREERRRLAALFRSLGLEVGGASPEEATGRSAGGRWSNEGDGGEANFLLVRGDAAPAMAARLGALGVRVRRFGDPSLRDAFRLTVTGDAAIERRVVRALTAATAPQALLLDMDGVLVDASNSYRAAIRDTCESFGVTITVEEIRSRSRKGNANNDWIVTRELLAARGVDRTLAEVTERFEAIYRQRRSSERPLVTRDELEEARRRMPIGIVTGRPRADATRFLGEAGVSDLIDALVTMEDAPAKPSPEPVRRACRALGIERAWFVGDTIDDVRAARAIAPDEGLDIVPFGVLAPGEPALETTDALMDAGAAEVLPDLRTFLRSSFPSRR